MAARKRPVITVVEARPMNEVGFRDAKASPAVPEVQSQSLQSKNSSAFKPPMSSNATNSNAVPMRPEKKITGDPKDALSFDEQLKKSSNPPPPKPRRTVAPRPVTVHIDSQNSIRPCEQKLTAPKPVQRLSIQSDISSNETVSQDSLVNMTEISAWSTNDWSLSVASTKAKPDVVPKRPTIIRVSACDPRSGGSTGPPPVRPKSHEAKLQAAQRMTVLEEGPSDSNNNQKLVAKPKPAVRPKPDPNSEAVQTEHITNIRKRPTIIRPLVERTTTPVANSSTAYPPEEKVAVTTAQLAVSMESSAAETSDTRGVASNIIHSGLSDHGSGETYPQSWMKLDMHAQESEIYEQPQDKPLHAISSCTVLPKKQPNVIRTALRDKHKDGTTESSVSVNTNAETVLFSTSGFRDSSEEQRSSMSPDVPEKQNAENWKKVELEQRPKAVGQPISQPSHISSFVGGQEGLSKKPPLKPPPPLSGLSGTERSSSSNIPNTMKSEPSSQLPSHQGPPSRPAVGPTKPTRPAQPAKRSSFIAEMSPSLPKRPTLGHPLFHYVATGPRAIALFEYKSNQPDELNFKAGELIILEKWINMEWLQGRTARTSGMFPSSFVDVIEPPIAKSDSKIISVSISGQESGSPALPGNGPRCFARFDYFGEDPADLVFAAGDLIHLVERVGGEWLKGELNGNVGMFPVSFVEIIEDLPPTAESISPEPSESEDKNATVVFDLLGQSGELSLLTDERPHCIALHDFVGQDADDLSFSAGDKITLLMRVSDDWFRGELCHRQGIFPASYVKIIKNIDEFAPDAERKPPEPAAASIVSSPTTMADSLPSDVSHKVPEEMIKIGVALYNYPGDTDEDLAFSAGDLIEITGVVNDDWMEGKINERSGIFPSAFVRLSE